MSERTAGAECPRDSAPATAAHNGNRVEHSPPLSPTSPPAVSTAASTPRRDRERDAASFPRGADARAAAEKTRRKKAEALREKRRRKVKQEEAKRDAAAAQRRTIPTAPRRQLFLVDGFYCDADPSGPFEERQEAVLQANQRDGRGPMGGGGGGGSRPGADPVALSNRIGTGPSRPQQSFALPGAGGTVNNGLSFYVSPSVPANFQIGGGHAGNNNNNDRTPSPNRSSASPPLQAGDTSAGHAHKTHKHKKLLIKQRFYEPVELQVESLSAFVMRLMMFMWYAALVAALVIEVIPRVQWSLVNICGSAYPVNLRHLEKWTSACVTSIPMPTSASSSATVVLTWSGQNFDHLHAKLVRYRRVVVSLPPPPDQVQEVQDYDLVASTTIDAGGLRWTSNRSLTLRCHRTRSRCNTVRVPEDLLAETRGATSYSFELQSVPASMAAGATDGAVGIAYQRSSYTVATVVWRYVLLFLSFLHALRFVAFRKYTSTLYEQGWTLALQIALLWYLDPLFALNIVSWPMPSVLAFLEYRVPTYFVAVFIAYMMSVMTASMAWPTPAKVTGPQSIPMRVKAFLLRSRNVYDPPMWTKLTVGLYLIAVFVLDIVDACVEPYDWYAASNSNTRFKRLYWAVVALLLFGGLVCLLMLLYLRNYLGNKPYLESRPQQLACRVFMMIFLSAVVYYIIHCLVFFLLYNHDYSALASQQPFLQLPTLMVASFFSNIMTLVYTSQNRDDNVPINPKDPRWKHMVWPDTWYRWLARHGGSQYIFSTEAEETRFYRLQFEFRKRQFMAKQKRKQLQQQIYALGGGGSGANEQQSMSLGTQRGAAHSGFFSMFRTQNAAMGRAAAAAAATRPGPRSGYEPPWRTDVWETPMPSRPMSPVVSDRDSDVAGMHELPGGTADTGAGNNAGAGAGAAATAAVPSSSGNYRPNNPNAGAVWGDNATSVNLAARSILNMDRFSTYFLAGGGSAATSTAADGFTGPLTPPAVGSGGVSRERWQNSRLPSPTQSPQREPRSTLDTFEVEGPARRRSRLQQQQSASASWHRENSALRREQSVTVAERKLALNRTFAGFENRAQGGSSQTVNVSAPLLVGSPARGSGVRHARSRSDGDVLRSVMASGGGYGGEGRRSSPATNGQQPQEKAQQHHDPMVGSAGAASAPPTAQSSKDVVNGGGTPHPRRDEETDPCRSGSSDDTAVDCLSNTQHAQHAKALLQVLQQTQQAPSASPSGTFLKGPHALPTFQATPISVQQPRTDYGTDALHNSNNGTPAGSAGAANAWQRSASPLRATTSSGMPRPPNGATTRATLAQSIAVDDMASDLSMSSGEDNGDGERGHGKHSFFRTLNVVRERLGAVMGVAERNLFEKPVRNLDRLEMQIFDAAYRPFQSMHYLPFFNLETAIDCYNISWEAYGVEKSLGDDMIETGIKMTPQNVPKTVAHGVKKIVCGCCAAEDDSSQDEEDSEEEASEHEEGGGTDGDGIVRVPRANTNNATHNSNSRSQNAECDGSISAAVPPARSSGREAKQAKQEEHEMLARNGAATVVERNSNDNDDNNNNSSAPDALHRTTVNHSDDAVVMVHMSGEGNQNNVPTAERAPEDTKTLPKLAEDKVNKKSKKDSHQDSGDGQEAQTTPRQAAADARPSRGIAQGGPATTHEAPPPASTPAAATDPALYPINVEKYGFTLLLVAEAKEVQVIMVKMDTNAPEHKGKAPRIIIGFRGTANISNAKYDMNIHRVVWREMERTVAEDNRDGLDTAPMDMTSTLDGASTMGSQHLGCTGCWRSCVRATSWRPTCHAGFLSIWKTLKPTVMRRLREVVREDRSTVYRIFCTGHSLGGALASLCAYSVTTLLRRLDYPIPEVTVYTYGQPRLGNRTFQRIYNETVPRSFSVVNESDMVVSMTMFGGCHVGIEVNVDRYGNFIVKPTEIERLFPPTKGRGLAVINHLMTNYGISLNAIATRTTCPARGLGCYLTADPEKIAREKAKEEALKQMQNSKRPADPNTHTQ